MAVIAGNWKMHKTAAEAAVFISELARAPRKEGREIIIAPPYTVLAAVAQAAAGTGIHIAAQNMHYEEKGAFTGEVSPLHVRDTGATRVIVGHSERRHVFGENDAFIARKIHAAVAHGLKPIFCIGETLAEREAGKTFDVLAAQVTGGLALIEPASIRSLLFAYEPVWAIGTGVTATPEQAQEAHRYINEFVAKKYFNNAAGDVTILYGGSVTPDNIDGLMEKPSIGGVLVGGASLKVDSFIAIMNYKEK